MWLLDASVLLASEDRDDANHRDAVRLLSAPAPLSSLDLAHYEVANVAAARVLSASLVSCDVRDLVSKGLAVLPGDAHPDGKP